MRVCEWRGEGEGGEEQGFVKDRRGYRRGWSLLGMWVHSVGLILSPTRQTLSNSEKGLVVLLNSCGCSCWSLWLCCWSFLLVWCMFPVVFLIWIYGILRVLMILSDLGKKPFDFRWNKVRKQACWNFWVGGLARRACQSAPNSPLKFRGWRPAPPMAPGSLAPSICRRLHHLSSFKVCIHSLSILTTLSYF